jgi:hypothetical protein
MSESTVNGLAPQDAYYALMKKFRECMNTEIRGKVFVRFSPARTCLSRTGFDFCHAVAVASGAACKLARVFRGSQFCRPSIVTRWMQKRKAASHMRV